MRLRHLAIAAALTAGLAAPARAQIPVTDVAALVRTIANHVETLTQWQQQFQEWERQYRSLNGLWNDMLQGDLAGGLTSEMRNTFPAELEDYMAEGGALFGGLLDDLTRVREAMSILPEDFFPQDSALAQQARDVLGRISRQQAAAQNTYRAAQRNIEVAERLRDRIASGGNGADTIQKSAQMTARITAELLAVQAEANRLTSIAMRMESDAEERAQNVREQILEANARPVVLP